MFRSKGDCAASLKVGDKVTATGEIINYGGTIEFQYASLTVPAAEDETLPTIGSILEEAASLTDGKTLSGNRKTVGTVKEIKDPYSSQYKNITFILTDGTNDILVFRSKGDCAESLKVGDKVYVEGEVINYGGTIEFQYAALTTGNESTQPEEVKLSTVKQVLDAAKDLADGSYLTGEYMVSGTVSGFEKKFSYGGGDYHIFYITDATGTIYIYRPAGDALATLKNGDTVFVKGKVKNYKGTIEFEDAAVSFDDDYNSTYVEKLTDAEKTPVVPEGITGDYKFISIPHIIAIAKDGGDDFTSSESYYITGYVTNIANPYFGELTITDGNVTIYAYGLSNYQNFGKMPQVGDVVVIKAIVGTKGSDVELKNTSELVEVVNVELEDDYTESTIAQAREAEAGSKVIVSGVVAGFTYKNVKVGDNYVRDGLYIVNGTDSIYLYGAGIAYGLEVGNTIKVAGVKEFFVQESEINLAQKFGFSGACQLSDVVLISNDNGNTEFKNNAFTETTVKELMENEYDENITTQIYKVNALINKVPGQGFVNYYINDLDGTTGTYTYTKCNGNDFAWIDSYLNANGQYLCTLLVAVQNAKATASGCIWRFMPVTILDAYEFDKEDTPKFVFDYYVAPQFDKEYYADPAIKLVTTHSSTLLGYENATISYASSNTEVITITDGVLNIIAVGKANVEVTVSYNGKTYQETIELVRASEPTFDALTVAEAIAATKESTVTVIGIVGPGLANQTGFYLIDETGVISVTTTKEELAKFKQGNRVVIEGVRTQNRATATLTGQAKIGDAVLVHNYFGEHEYSTATFKQSTLADVHALIQQTGTDHTTDVYIIEASITSSGFTNIIGSGDTAITIYCSGAGQVSWAVEAANGQVVKMEVALCNWNEKTPYKCAILAIYLADGTKVVNPNNFAQ